MTKFINATDIYATDKTDCPEKRLFIAILSQAVHDAFSEHVSSIEKRAARGFLKSNSEDFKLICELAGRNSDYVKEKIRIKVLRENGWNVDVSLRTKPRRRKQMKEINKKHLTGNAYYAAKRANEATTIY
jgi:hypothetical protein|tara:strand:+ start:33 stop:422 length:390 start_codon:yes stop_codon:yes gene_type:complete